MLLAAALLAAMTLQDPPPPQSKGGWGKADSTPSPAPVQLHPAQPWLFMKSTPLDIRVHQDAARVAQQRGLKKDYTFQLRFSTVPDDQGEYLADAQAFFHGYPVMGVFIRFLYACSDKDHPVETITNILRVDFLDFPRSTQVDLSDPITVEEAARLSGHPDLAVSNLLSEPPFLVLYPRCEHLAGSGGADRWICKDMTLAYLFPTRYYFYVDAHTGKLLAKVDMAKH